MNPPRIKTKQELYQEDKHNLDNEITFKLKTYGLKKQKHLIDVTYNNPYFLKQKHKRKFNELITELNTVYDMNFPYNIDLPYVVNSEFNTKFFNKKDVSFCCKEYARLTRWLEIACKDIRYLYDYLRKHCSSNGMNSPHNRVNVWVLSQIGSPYKVEKLLRYINKETKNLLELFDFEYLYPNQLLIQNKIEYLFEHNLEFKFNKFDMIEFAIGTIFRTYFKGLVAKHMYPDSYYEDDGGEKYTNEKEIIKSKLVGEYLLDKCYDINDIVYIPRDELIEFGMFLSNLRNRYSNDYMNYTLRLL